jgi:Fe-S-cluster containining protein
MQKRYDILQYLYGNPWRPPYESRRSEPSTLAEGIKNSVEDYSFERIVKNVFEQIAEAYDNNTDLWFDSITGEELTTCPFLHKAPEKDQYECLIHETKPEVCCSYYCSDLKEHDQPELGRAR